MKRLMTYCLCAVTMALCLSCGSDDESESSGIRGWYCTEAATASDFDEINEAIADNELLSDYKYGGKIHKYYATRDLFIDSDGYFNDSDAHFGRLRFSIDDIVVNVVQIVDNSTLIKYNAMLCESGSSVTRRGEVVYKIYAGHIFGNMDYCDENGGTVYTYVKSGNKIITSSGDVYTFVDGGLLKDGSSMSNIMRKYDPNVRY